MQVDGSSDTAAVAQPQIASASTVESIDLSALPQSVQDAFSALLQEITAWVLSQIPTQVHPGFQSPPQGPFIYPEELWYPRYAGIGPWRSGSPLPPRTPYPIPRPLPIQRVTRPLTIQQK